MSKKTIGLIINPIAGMGGRVGLKGTDGVYEEAIAKGAHPVAPDRGAEALGAFLKAAKERADAGNPFEVEWLTCKGTMGAFSFQKAGFDEGSFRVVYEGTKDQRTTSQDTLKACSVLIENKVDLVVFVGGDGTARDVFSVVKDQTLMLGIPSGVKMHSGVFCIDPRVASSLLQAYLDDYLEPSSVEILDLDEERYRKGEWNIKLFGYAKTPFEPTYIQGGKVVIKESEDEVLEDIAYYISELMGDEPETLWILGSGGTLLAIGEEIGIDKSLLGIDVVLNKELIAKDVNEERLLDILERHDRARLVVSPIGSQGFILGRGNLQLSPPVLRGIGIDNIVIVSTPAKLNRTPLLRVDTGDPALDREFREKKHVMVIVGDHFKRMHPIGQI